MVRVRRLQPNNGAVLVIQPLALPVPMRQLQTFFLPKAFHLLVIDVPAFDAQQLGHLAISVPAILLGQTNHCEPQRVVILGRGFVLQRAAC
jgi:hypothetical protein